MTTDVTADQLARLRTRFAAASEAVGPLFEEVQETGRRAFAAEMATVGAAVDAATAAAGEEFRRMGERVEAATQAAMAEMTTKLVADLNAIGTAGE